MGRASYEAGAFAAAIAGFDALEANYPDSTYLDNGRYCLGRCHFDQGQFAEAIPPLQRVFETVDSIHLDNAQFYIARSEYALGQLAPALADFQELVTTSTTSQYVDNSLRYEVQVFTDQGDCTSAQDTLTQLQTQFPSSDQSSRAQSYMANNGC